MSGEHGAGSFPLLWVVGLPTAALALRMVFLTTKALWFDETVSVFIASQPIERIMPLLAANDPHPPLHYFLLHVWLALFGRRLIGGGALVAAGLVALAPAQIAASQEARMYGLLTLTSLLSWWALRHALAGERIRAWAAYALAVAAMLYTHYFGVFVVGAPGQRTGCRSRRQRCWTRSPP